MKFNLNLLPYALLIIGFIALLGFFDRNNIFTQIRITQEMNKLKMLEQSYKEEIALNKENLHQLMNNPDALEKYARENYFVKRDNEEIYLIVGDTLRSN
jgi:cell division protein FtsB